MDKRISTIIMHYSQDIIKLIKLKQNRMDKEYYIRLVSRYKRAKVLLIDDLFNGNVNESDKIIFLILLFSS